MRLLIKLILGTIVAVIVTVCLVPWLAVFALAVFTALHGWWPATVACVALLLSPLLSKEFRKLLSYWGPGTVYCLKVDGDATGYVGKTYRPWLERINEHLHGGQGKPPQVWAGSVTRYYQIYHADFMWGVGLAIREIVCIRWMKPIHNVQHNMDNKRRMTKEEARFQAEIRGPVEAISVPVARRGSRGRTGAGKSPRRVRSSQRVEGRIRLDSSGRVVRSGSFWEK